MLCPLTLYPLTLYPLTPGRLTAASPNRAARPARLAESHRRRLAVLAAGQASRGEPAVA
jgi:hypothetical protein